MRTLRFIVDNETIKQDPSCDFTGLFPGKNSDIRAEFVFSPEWKNKVKVAAFWSTLDKEYDPQVIEEDACSIPVEALDKASFKIQVLGKRSRDFLYTNKLTILQTGGRR